MLSKEEEHKLDNFILQTQQLPAHIRHYCQTTPHWQWICQKLKEVNEELKRANAEIERINKAHNWEDPCPHGYKKGDHHWYNCMGVSPFNDSATEA